MILLLFFLLGFFTVLLLPSILAIWLKSWLAWLVADDPEEPYRCDGDLIAWEIDEWIDGIEERLLGSK